MSISELEIFNRVKLSAEDNENLRVMILDGNPGNEFSYYFIGAVVTNSKNSRVFIDFMHTPTMQTFESIQCVQVMFGGCTWIYLISKNPKFFGVAKLLTKSGVLRLNVVHFENIPYLSHMIQNFNQIIPESSYLNKIPH